MRRNTEEKVIAYTITSDVDETGDLPAAEEVAEHLRLKHEVITINPDRILMTVATIAKTLDELSCPIHEALPKFLLLEAASKDVKLLLTGDCIDASFFGHDSFYQCATVLKWMGKTPSVVKQPGVSLMTRLLSKMKNMPPYNREEPGAHAEFITYLVTLKRLLNSSLSRDAHHLIESYFYLLADTDENFLLPHFEHMSSLRHLETELPFQQPSSDILTDLYAVRKKDFKFVISRKSMAQYWDIAFRQPFKIDTNLQEIATKLSPTLKQPSSHQTKHILRVTASNYQLLPQHIIYRPKHQLIPFPLYQWLQREFQLENQTVRQLLKPYEDIPHLNKQYITSKLRKGTGRLLGKLLLLAQWYDNHKLYLEPLSDSNQT